MQILHLTITREEWDRCYTAGFWPTMASKGLIHPDNVPLDHVADIRVRLFPETETVRVTQTIYAPGERPGLWEEPAAPDERI